jgi:hypothetical protein
MCWGLLAALPGRMSLTRTVPPVVPSVFQNSIPVAGEKAVKNRSLPTPTKPRGLESPPSRIEVGNHECPIRGSIGAPELLTGWPIIRTEVQEPAMLL